MEIVPQGDRLLVRTNQDRVPGQPAHLRRPGSDGAARHGGGSARPHRRLRDDATWRATWSWPAAAATCGCPGWAATCGWRSSRSDLIRAVDVKGRVDLQGRGSDVELENIAGQVTINGAYSGTLEFKNLAKPLQFEGARNTELHVQAVPGRISMDLGEFNGHGPGGSGAAGDRSRDIKLEQFTQSLELETERGDIELQPGKLPLPAIEARSGSGRIDLVLPEKAAFQLDATAERGDAVNDFGPPIEKESEGRTRHFEGQGGRRADHPAHGQSRLGSRCARKAARRATMPDTSDEAAPPMPPQAAQDRRRAKRCRNQDVMC